MLGLFFVYMGGLVLMIALAFLLVENVLNFIYDWPSGNWRSSLKSLLWVIGSLVGNFIVIDFLLGLLPG